MIATKGRRPVEAQSRGDEQVQWRSTLAAVTTVLVVSGSVAACGSGEADGQTPSTAAPSSETVEPSPAVSVEPSPAAPTSPEEEVAALVEQRFRDFVVIRDEFLVLPSNEITTESIPLDQVTVGSLRLNLGRAQSLMPLYDERVVGFQGTTEVVRVEVAEVDLDPVEDERDGLTGIEGTAVVQACTDTSAVFPVDIEGQEVADAVRDPDFGVSAFDVVLVANEADPRQPGGADWYLVEATEPVGEIPCP